MVVKNRDSHSAFGNARVGNSSLADARHSIDVDISAPYRTSNCGGVALELPTVEERRWRRIDDPDLVSLARGGVESVDGKHEERADWEAA